MPQGKHGEDIILRKLFSPTQKWYIEGRYTLRHIHTCVCGGICYTIGEPITIFLLFSSECYLLTKMSTLVPNLIIFLYSRVTPQIKYLFLNRCTQIFYPKPSMRKLGIKILDWIHAKTSQLIMIWKNWSWFLMI